MRGNKSDFKVVKFIQEVKVELKKVSWPTREETVRLTFVVIAISTGVGIFITTADYLFTKAVELFISQF